MNDEAKQKIRSEYNELKDIFGRYKAIMQLRKTFKLSYSDLVDIIDNRGYPKDCFDPRRDMAGIMIIPYSAKVSSKKKR